MSFNKKVIKLLKEKKKSKADLAKAAGIPYTTLDSMLKRDSDTARFATIYKIAQYLEVSVEELVFEKDSRLFDREVYTEEEKKLISDYRLIDSRGKGAVCALIYQEKVATEALKKRVNVASRTRAIPLYNAPAAAGEALPIIADDYITVETDEAPTDATFGIRISGDSMEPEIRDESIVWVKRQETLSNGDIGIFLLNGESLCKKYDFTNGKCTLISLNKKYNPIEILETDDLRVVGKVLS